MSLPRMAVFFTVVLGVAGALHYYVWTRLVRDAGLGQPWSRIATVTIALFATGLPLGMILPRFLPRSLGSTTAWIAYTWLGLLYFLVVLSFGTDLLRWTAGVLHPGVVNEERRYMLRRVLSLCIGTGALALGAVGMAEVLGPVAVRRVRVPLRKLPRARSGYTIVQLSDIHVGPTIGREFIERLVEQTNQLQPDMIAITGDLVDGSVEALGALVEPLRRLSARDGVYFVTGNHEYYSGADVWLDHLRSLGIRVLRNERVTLREGLDLAGVDDWSAEKFGGDHGMDIDKALADRDENHALVLLAHQPRAIHQASHAGVDLQLSGHTHGGQLFPWRYLVYLQQPYIDGLHTHGRAKIYVSRGTGYWGPPMRLGAPAELAHIELVADHEARDLA